jgi:hypothetical protein
MMSLEKVRVLEDKYQFFRPERGVECGDGWHKIIDRLCKSLSDVDLKGAKIVIVKEKFGGLRVGLSSIGMENYPTVVLAIKHAEENSVKVCEECGRSGRVRNINGWLKTLCDGCSAKL